SVEATYVHFGWPGEFQSRPRPGDDAPVYHLNVDPAKGCPFPGGLLLILGPESELSREAQGGIREELTPFLTGRQRRLVAASRWVVVLTPGDGSGDDPAGPKSHQDLDPHP